MIACFGVLFGINHTHNVFWMTNFTWLRLLKLHRQPIHYSYDLSQITHQNMLLHKPIYWSGSLSSLKLGWPAYVALSRVRSLSGLYLSTFDPNSLIASPSCTREVNRLREAYRKDLPLYDVPRQTKTRATKRKLTGEVDVPKARKLVKLATKTLVKKQ